MRLRTALNDYKRRRGETFPAECPTRTGALSGYGDRLVHIHPDGSFRDHSAPLSGLYGVDRSRFGIRTGGDGDGALGDGEIEWFDDIDPVRQHYYDDTNLVETEYDAGEYTVHQYDLTLGRAHITHVELRGEIPPNAHLTAFVTFAPEGRETRVGRLIHEDAGPEDGKVVEVFSREEHDYIAASTGINGVTGQIPERFEELLGDEPVDFPRRIPRERYEDHHLSGDVVVSAPLEREGRAATTTLVTQLSDHTETNRERALADIIDAAERHAGTEPLRRAARERVRVDVPDETPRSDVVVDDLRALSLLQAPSGARIAGPEFDPFYAYSGGYGYTWFRDDSEVARHMLEAADSVDLDLNGQLIRSATFYCDTQREDGTWPHRVWASDGSLAPGWAHARVEGSDSPEYQADQTASVTTFLAALLRDRWNFLETDVRERLRETIGAAVDGLDASMEDDGLPEECQNLWENMDGRFTHTAATFLGAYATVASAPVGDHLKEHARSQADRIVEALDDLWVGNHYGLGLRGGEVDDRLDSGTFALIDAVAAYDEVADVSKKRLNRLVKHTQTALDRLHRETGAVAGIIRFEGDYWRAGDQHGEKVWSVSTAWGANAAARLGRLLQAHDREDDAEDFLERAGNVYSHLLPGETFCTGAGFLAEQVFDDGRPDSATPLGWSHALRFHTTTLLNELGALPTATTPSGPGDRPRWTTAEKYGIGTVADHTQSDASKVWFTLTEGALTELRYPRVDVMNLRTLDFLVVDPQSEYTARTHNETRRDDHADTVERTAEIVDEEALIFRQTIRETGDGSGRGWTLSAEYVADPEHDAVLADVSFRAHDDRTYEVYAVADTALVNTGDMDRGYRLGPEGDYHLAARDAGAFDAHHGDSLLVDEEGEPYNVAVAMASEDRFEWATVDVAGSEALSRFFRTGERPDVHEETDDANIVLVGQVGVGRVDSTLALGFAENADTAGALGEAQGALARGYEDVHAAYADTWNEYLEPKPVPDSVRGDRDLEAQYNVSLMTLRAVEDKTFDGAGIASPSVPWGESVLADEPKGYGYNFVWSRDLYQVFTVFDAVDDIETAHDALSYVYEYQQDENGFIPQNTYLDGRTRWGGEQMDNISFPQVMAYHLAERGLAFEDADYSYENVRRSADYVARNGPATAQERWEEESGYSPSSIATEIAGLACAGKLAMDQGNVGDALVWLSLADEWTETVEDLTATTTGAAGHDSPYYVRITRNGNPDAGTHRTLANNGPTLDEREIIDAGFLELVRLGIKPADDPVMKHSLDVVDETIRVDTPHGPAFYRYNGDGYGELSRNEEGAPWQIDGTGKGRLWPIFTGERGEYELRKGTESGDLAPENMLRTMEGFANSGRMLPEQVWDREHSTPYNWEFGEGTGAATPLAWSMAQFVRLAHGIDEGQPIETPGFVAQRYLESERPDGPDLWADSAYEGGHIVVTIRSNADLVAVKTPSETVTVEPTSGEFVVRADVQPGTNELIVAAADHDDLETAGTTVERLTL